MILNAEQSGGQAPAPIPPAAPPPSWLEVLLRQRFFLVAAVILLFLVIVFSWEAFRHAEGPEGPEGVKEATIPGPPSPEAKAPLAPLETQKAERQPQPVPPPPKEPSPSSKEPLVSARETPPPSKETTSPPKESPPAPPKEAVSPPPPPPAAPREKIKGESFTLALIKIMDDQVNQTLFGWRPNTIVFGKMGLTDNVNNMQLGVLEVARRTIVVLNENLTRFAVTEAYNPNINEAMNFFMVSPDKYWFPSASGKYREAMHGLEIYLANLKQGRARFYTRVDNLIALVVSYKDILGSSYHNLIKDTEHDGKDVSWWTVDDYFYFSQGIAVGMAQMLEAVKEEFNQELLKKNCHKLLDDAIHGLHGASHLHPWVVTNGAKDGILANHRANMSTYIGEAEHVIATLQTVLATN